jgi:hypothetical protein
MATKGREVDLRPNQGFSITLANGCVVRAFVTKRKGRLRLHVYDAATGERIERFHLTSDNDFRILDER